MVLYFIGLGLGEAKDITVRGLEIVKRAAAVYLESYTSILQSTKKEMVSIIPYSKLSKNSLIISRKNYTENQLLKQIEH